MSDETPVLFNQDAYERMSAAVVTVEGWRRDATPRPARNNASPTETLFARLTSRVTEGWQWEEVYPRRGTDNKLTWVAAPASRKGSNSPADGYEKLLAVELKTGTAYTGQIVCLHRCFTEVATASPSATPTSDTQFAIIAPITSVLWGKLTGLWVPGRSYVTLQPVADYAGNPFPSPVPDPINVQILMPLNTVPAYLHGEVNAIFAYEDIGGGTYLLKNPQTTPIPTRKWEVIQNVGVSTTAPQWVADYMRSHDMAPPT